ncbi:hypothetical protein VTK56DRAFT_3758 [Thermocarpiscus australiensis]
MNACIAFIACLRKERRTPETGRSSSPFSAVNTVSWRPHSTLQLHVTPLRLEQLRKVNLELAVGSSRLLPCPLVAGQSLLLSLSSARSACPASTANSNERTARRHVPRPHGQPRRPG